MGDPRSAPVARDYAIRPQVDFARSTTWALAGAYNNACRYGSASVDSCVIKSFGDRDTQRLFVRESVRRFPRDLYRTMLRKLVVVDAAEALEDLRSPPGNRLKKLKGDRAGQHSIRINDQWRICFRWLDGNAYELSSLTITEEWTHADT